MSNEIGTNLVQTLKHKDDVSCISNIGQGANYLGGCRGDKNKLVVQTFKANFRKNQSPLEFVLIDKG